MSMTPTYVALPALKDFQPFGVDPALRWLHAKRVSPVGVWLGSSSLIGLAGLLAAVHEHRLLPGQYNRSVLSDLSTLFARPTSGTVGVLAVPLLRDYPTLILAFTIATAAPFIYSLFLALSSLHSTLARNGCLDLSTDHSLHELESDIDSLNEKVARHARPAMVVRTLAISYAAVAAMLLRQSHGGFYYLTASSDRVGRSLYGEWWARPFSAGFFVASTVGTIGAYLVYIEAVIGLNYVAFVRRHHATYRFRANRYNIDKNYGWSVLGRAYKFMLLGIATSTLSCFALYYFLKPEMPALLVLVLLGGFLAIVCYVSSASSVLLRRQVIAARMDACRLVSSQLERLRDAHRVQDLIRWQILTDELKYYRDIPDFPIRGVWLTVAAAITIAGVSGSIAQLIYVFTH